MLHPRWFVAAALLAAAACVTDSFARDATDRRCTMEFRVVRDLRATYVLGTSSADTVLAGAGPMNYGWPGARQAYYGQVVRVDSVEGKDAGALRATLRRRGSSDIIVVPQGSNAGCGPEPWHGSARFTKPNADGVFHLTAWPESLWIGGRPTFYAPLVDMQTYADGVGPRTHGPHGGMHWETDPAPLPNLSVAEYFDMIMALPQGHGDTAAFPRLSRWIDAHPLVRYRYPADVALRNYRNGSIRRPPRNEAELFVTTLIVSPINFWMPLPEQWFRATDTTLASGCGHHIRGSFARRLAVEHPMLDSARNAQAEWDREYSAVVDSILPFSQLVAQLGPEPFGGGTCFRDLQMRVYLGQSAPSVIGTAAERSGLPTARAFFPSATIAAKDSAQWRIDHLRWDARYSDYGAEANVELYSKVIDGQTITIVFMHVSWPGGVAERDQRYVLSHL